MMRPSRVLERFRAGKPVSCFKLNLADPRAADIAAMAGIDCMWLDMEHTANDWSAIEAQINASKMHNCDTMVRISKGSYSDYIRPLELDAAGIMVPHIMSAEEARKIAWMTRFDPIGRRPIDSGNADGSYCRIPIKEYIKQANEQRFIAIQIEDPEPLDELDEIASVEGIDMIFFGPGDFSHAIGDVGNMQHPLVVETKIRVAEVCKKYGKMAGTPANVNNVEELIAMGYHFLPMGADVLGISNYCDSIVNKMKEIGAA